MRKSGFEGLTLQENLGILHNDIKGNKEAKEGSGVRDYPFSFY